MLTIIITICVIATLLSFAFFWAALVVGKRNDAQKESDLLQDHLSPVESSLEYRALE
jgi:hypothetical protein